MERQFCLSKKDKNLLITDISTLLLARADVETAYLFGSFVAAETFGDIDIGVIFGKRGDTRGEIMLEQALEKEINFPIEVVDLNQAPISFQFRVISTGRLLMRKDDNRRCDFEEKTMVMYTDMKPIHKYWHQEVLLGPH